MNDGSNRTDKRDVIFPVVWRTSMCGCAMPSSKT